MATIYYKDDRNPPYYAFFIIFAMMIVILVYIEISVGFELNQIIILFVIIALIVLVMIHQAKGKAYLTDKGNISVLRPFSDKLFNANTYFFSHKHRTCYQFTIDNVKNIYLVTDQSEKDTLRKRYTLQNKAYMIRQLVSDINKAVCVEFKNPLNYSRNGIGIYSVIREIITKRPEMEKIYFSIAQPEKFISDFNTVEFSLYNTK